MRVCIIGSGIYSISLAFNIAKKKHQVVMWSEDEELVKYYKKKGKFKIVDNEVPNGISLTNRMSEAIENCDLIIIASQAKYVRSVCLVMKEFYSNDIPICIASKGIENDTCSTLSDVVKDNLKAKYVCVISGPTFAVDLIQEEACALSLASNSRKATRAVLEALESNHLKFRENNDVYGTQVCGSVKNVIAIAAGILDGLGCSESTRAFLLTESLHDIKELLYKLECNPKTILSFAGIGDLILTASSTKSRNYRFGLLVGKGASKEEIDKYLKRNTTEGYYTLMSIKELTKNRKIKMPIINIIYDIVVKGDNPKRLKEFLIEKE